MYLYHYLKKINILHIISKRILKPINEKVCRYAEILNVGH